MTDPIPIISMMTLHGEVRVNCLLDNLYADTEALVHGPDRLTHILEWRERTPPQMPMACRDAVLAKAPPVTFDRWLSWLDGPGCGTLAESGSRETTDCLVFWLRTLVMTAGALARGADALLLAEELRSGSAGTWPWLTDAFWRNLIAYLSTPPRPARLLAEAGPPQVRFQFPLVLSEAVIVDGAETDQVLAEFVLEACPTSGGQVFPHPEQMTVRCLDPEFGTAFRLAAAAARSVTGDAPFPDVSVRIQPFRPEDEVFLREFVLRGGSGAGALALGLCLLRHGSPQVPSVADMAASFALGAADGRWRCLPVGDLERKVRCCARARLRALIVSDQDAGPALTGFAKRSGIALAGERDFADAADRLPKLTRRVGRVRPRLPRVGTWKRSVGVTVGLALLTLLAVTPQLVFSARRALHRAGDPLEAYDASQNFPLYENPSPMWAYGTMSPGEAPDVATFRPYRKHVQQSSGIVQWEDPIWRDPNVLKNMSGAPIQDVGIAWPTNQLSLHPGWRGQYSAVRWTAPRTGRYQIDAEFSGLDTNGPTATDAHVLRNGTALACGDVSPSHPLLFSRQVPVARGDRVYFVVGWGRKKRYEAQTTGLDLLITRR